MYIHGTNLDNLFACNIAWCSNEHVSSSGHSQEGFLQCFILTLSGCSQLHASIRVEL